MNNSCATGYPSLGKARDPQEMRATHAYWKRRKQAILDAYSKDIPGLFKGALNGELKPIEAGPQDAILSYMNRPSLEAWLELRSILISPSMTLWRAWAGMDPAAPLSGSSGPYPSREALAMAIRKAVDADLAHAQAMLQANPEPKRLLRLVK